MESRIHGDMYVRFGGGLTGTYHREVAKRCWPSLLKEIADGCRINKNLTFHIARHTFATTVTLSNGVPIETVSKMLGHTYIKQTQHYAKMQDSKVSKEMIKLEENLLDEVNVEMENDEVRDVTYLSMYHAVRGSSERPWGRPRGKRYGDLWPQLFDNVLFRHCLRCLRNCLLTERA